MLEDISWLRQELDRITKDVDNQILDLQPFIEGRKQSKYPLGSKLLIQTGHQLEQLCQELEYRLTGMVS